MATDDDIQEFRRALTGGWSMTRASSFTLITLRAACADHAQQDEWGRQAEKIKYKAGRYLNWYGDEDEAALDLLMAERFAVGERLAGLTEEAFQVCERMKRLAIPSEIVPASRELLLHGLYQAGRSGMVLRDAYWGRKQPQRRDERSRPEFEPWLVFAGEVISLERFEDALDYLVNAGLALMSRKSCEITGSGRELIESSPRSMAPGYLLAALNPRSSGSESDREPSDRSGNGQAAAVGPATVRTGESSGLPSNRVTYVIHGNVSNLVGNTGNVGASTVNIANGIDVAALAAAAEQLRTLLPALQMSPADSAESAELIAGITTESAVPSPDRGRLHQVLRKLGDVIARSRGPLTEIAIGVVNEQIKRLAG